jgi:3,4-dihydroxy 2-butanone 4-phosphate synthase / GTP cyclohydrolase II
MTISILPQLLSLIHAGSLTRSGLARATGLHPNTLRNLGEPDWNPTADTLARLEAYLEKIAQGTAIASAEEIINEARNGRMFILVDDEDRENEGDLIIPAQMATPEAIAFMASHGRGLICLCLTKERVDALELDLMSRHNRSRHGTAFTVSIEAREGIDTGISASDRARTVAVAIDGSKDSRDIVSPGHVFPLVAREGGVLVRAGHTEAAVDVARLAGLNPSAVICEIMQEDGTMARLSDLIPYAAKHKMKIGTIRDLIAYRMRHDHLLERTAETYFTSQWGGEWKVISFYNQATHSEQLVLQMGEIAPDSPTWVRMHPFSPFTDLFAEAHARGGLLQRAMESIARHGAGLIVLLHHAAPDTMRRIIQAREGTLAQDESATLRDYGVGAQILAEMGVHEMVLLSNSHHAIVALDGYGLAVVGQQEI